MEENFEYKSFNICDIAKIIENFKKKNKKDGLDM
jgi:hypothetical protein